MFARSFLVVLGLVVIANIATANNFPQAVQTLSSAYPWANMNCIYQAANICMIHWSNQQQLLFCGGSWLQRNKGQCMKSG
ncbi:hypothetical protein TSAR_013567 [Trichomalopsis sarcophagae]|uniref:Chitin-binding type-2 domain-containing protein n=1 Tax=Trichomalopsis sarcophagae TaxID=543379 RepID=A0A232FA01_9HYME|nr:hypothetical protein TSAR_013567 [Trichomalopsis sarcophagae]